MPSTVSKTDPRTEGSRALASLEQFKKKRPMNLPVAIQKIILEFPDAILASIILRGRLKWSPLELPLCSSFSGQAPQTTRIREGPGIADTGISLE